MQTSCVALTSKINYNKILTFLYIPSNWKAIIFGYKLPLCVKSPSNNNNFFYLYLYSKHFFFYLTIPSHLTSVTYDKLVNLFFFNFKRKNNFHSFFWKCFIDLFFSFSYFFFKKLKFKGKGYYIFKNLRNTIALQFGYSHKMYIYTYFLFVKFISKTVVILFGINKTDLILKSFQLFYTRSYNIFTSKGIRFAKQIIYKKMGKISSYR